MSRSYDIDHEAEHKAECFNAMLAALKAIRDDMIACGIADYYSEARGCGVSGAVAEVNAAIAHAERSS